MLVVNSLSKEILACAIEWQKIDVVIGAAMQDAASAIDGRVDQGVGGAAVLGLNVINRIPHLHVRVMPEEHIGFVHSPVGGLDDSSTCTRRRIFLTPFDRLAVEWIL